ncbi:MAG TPA: AraC family ligand binding domain-containing protein [Actinomycetota bacterium]|nr:AraC family ligand binding domain-containing protein [Actinomycetota bacterium]
MLRFALPLHVAETHLDSLIAYLESELILMRGLMPGRQRIVSRPDSVGGWMNYYAPGTKLVLVTEGEGWVHFGSTRQPVGPGDLLIWNDYDHVRVGPTTPVFSVRDLHTESLEPDEVRMHFDESTPNP